MSDDPLDLSPLAPSDAVRERVVAAALETIVERPSATRVHPERRPAPPATGTPLWRLALEGAAPFALPALAAAALVVLVAWGRLGGRADDDGASPGPLLAAPPGPWSAWIAGSTAPTPQQILVTFTRDSP